MPPALPTPQPAQLSPRQQIAATLLAALLSRSATAEIGLAARKAAIDTAVILTDALIARLERRVP
jgi:hypothetical protein